MTSDERVRNRFQLSPGDTDPNTKHFSLDYLELLYAQKAGTDPDFVREASVNVRPEESTSHPFTYESAIVDCVKNRDMARKIGTGFYRDRLVLVVNTPKSASTAFRNCVAYLHHKNTDIDRVGLAQYMTPNHDYDLRPAMLKDFPNGGVLKRPARPTGTNLKVIEDLGVKTVFMLRHPKDQLIAWTVQLINSDEQTRKYNPICPEYLPPDALELDELLEFHIRQGMVVNMLQWMVDWLRFRPTRSTIVTYECIMNKRRATFDELSDFLYGRGITNEDEQTIDSLLGSYKAIRTSEIKYPRGYTGRVGAWKDYLNESNSRLFDDIASRFLEIYDPDHRLREFYDLSAD